MATKEEWNETYSFVMPMLGTIISALGVSISLLALQQSQAAAELGYASVGVKTPKVHYDDGQVFVQVRTPGEWHELREFVRPDDPCLTQIISEALSG